MFFKIKILLFLLISFSAFTQNLAPRRFGEDIIIKHYAYTLNYSVEHKQARWNYYILSRYRTYNKVKRSNKFLRDPLISVENSPDPSSFKYPGFDRGHLVPAEDMDFDPTAMKESFFFTNISPQNSGFNKGVWKKLEIRVHRWKDNFDTLHVITGGYIHKGLPKLNGEVSIPNNFYKIVLTKDGNGIWKSVAFLIPNETSKAPLKDFLVTIDELENLTQLDFCYELHDQIEESLEACNADLSFWKL